MAAKKENGAAKRDTTDVLIDFDAFILGVTGEKIPLDPDPKPGLPAPNEDPTPEEPEYMKLGRVCINALMNPGPVDPRTGRLETPLTEEEKIKRSEIAFAMSEGKEVGEFNAVTLSDPQITMLKEAVHGHNDSPLIYARTVQLLKGKED